MYSKLLTASAAVLVALTGYLPARAQTATVDLPEAPEGVEYIPLSSLDISKGTCGWGTIQANKSINGNPITLRDTVYTSGVGTHAASQFIVKLNGSVSRFYTRVGMDDETISDAQKNASAGRAHYRVYLRAQDGSEKVVSEGDISALDSTTVEIDTDVNGWKYLFLEATIGNGTDWSDHVDWANAYLEYQEQNSTRPAIVSAEEISSKLDCPVTLFSQPGVRFMQKVRTASSDATVTLSGLPAGLEWNAKRQIVSGIIDEPGTYQYDAHITLDGETTDETFTLTVSDSLLLPTPAMAWVSWNAVQSDVSEDIVEQVADLFEAQGLIDLGWNTIVMDDWWHANTRATDGSPQPNATRFPNGIKAVADYVHGKKMKLGIYTDMGSNTCAGAFGSYGYETVDANAYAAWGIDFVKNDYCNAPSDEATCRSRYKTFGDALKASGRPIVLEVCEWGVREPWKWGAEVGGQQWRCTQDRRDCWIGSGTGVGITQSIDLMKDLAQWQGVNRWNDADMLTTGIHGKGKSSSDLCLTGPGMTMDEYRTEFALWCMWSSPLQLSFDPRANTVTDEDWAIMKNAELIAINQDPMGQQADCVSYQDSIVVFAKDLENGDVAISVTNLDARQRSVTVRFADVPALSDTTTYTVRDLWAQSDLADAEGSLTTTVKSHATQVFRLSPKQPETGILASATAKPARVSLRNQSLTVSLPGTEGYAKRIVVTDLQGRVLATASGTKAATHLRVPETTSPLLIRAVCNGRARSWKVQP